MVIKSPVINVITTKDALPALDIPVQVTEPETAYDKLALSCSVNTLTNNGVDVVINIAATPYRVLKDGSVEMANCLPFVFSSAGINGIRASKDVANIALCTKVDNLIKSISSFLELM